MTNETVSSSIDSKHHRARCPSCGVTCEQRARTVRELTGDILQARECIECEMIYRVSEPADRLVDAEPYGCVNRRTSSPRECVESGHYWCDAFKSKPGAGDEP